MFSIALRGLEAVYNTCRRKIWRAFVGVGASHRCGVWGCVRLLEERLRDYYAVEVNQSSRFSVTARPC